MSRIVLTFALFFILSATALSQTTWYVDDDNTSGPWDGSQDNPFQYIQDGINAASDGDTVLVKPGKYVGNINYFGKAITVKSTNGVHETIIDGNREGTVVTFESGEGPDSIIEGFFIRNGFGTGNYSGGGITCSNSSSPTITDNAINENQGEFVGGISCFYSSPTIKNNRIIGNSSYFVGGISCYESSPTITKNTINWNSANCTGGGIYCHHLSPTITNNELSGNSAYRGAGIFCSWASPMIAGNLIGGNSEALAGGGIYAVGWTPNTPIISNNTIGWNSAEWGAGIACDERASPMITGNIIRENATTNPSPYYGGGGIACKRKSSAQITDNIIFGNWGHHGGGIFCGSSSSPMILNNSIYENSAHQGGGFYICTAPPKIINNTITDNCAYTGGGFYCDWSAAPVITNNTICGNSAYNGGGVYCFDSSPAITNTILCSNDAAIGSQIDLSLESNPKVRFCNVEGGWPGKGNIDAHPRFVSAFEGDFHLRFGSPCIDAGNNKAAGIPGIDYEGDGRIVDGNWPLDGESIADMGADELLPEIASRFGSVNAGSTNLSNVLFVNDSPGDSQRVYTTSSGAAVLIRMDSPPGGPTPSPFAIYIIQREPGLSDVATQPFAIGVSCMPMPLSNGSPNPPPICLVNNIGFTQALGYPFLHWIGPAPCTILNLPFGLTRGTYTLQGYIFDSGSAGLGVSLTNAIVLKVQ